MEKPEKEKRGIDPESEQAVSSSAAGSTAGRKDMRILYFEKGPALSPEKRAVSGVCTVLDRCRKEENKGFRLSQIDGTHCLFTKKTALQENTEQNTAFSKNDNTKRRILFSGEDALPTHRMQQKRKKDALPECLQYSSRKKSRGRPRAGKNGLAENGGFLIAHDKTGCAVRLGWPHESYPACLG